MVSCQLLAILLAVISSTTRALDNGLALTPPMGWMPWERFRCVIDCESYPEECVSEQLFKRHADLMVSEGFLAAGYEYVIIDDCWMANERDENGKLVADPMRFPSGIKKLAEYMHERGLKLGIYADYGNFTCEGYPGSINHLEIDANTFAEWDVDYLKVDACFHDKKLQDGFTKFGRFLNATGRPIVYSCSWPHYEEIVGLKKPNYAIISKYCNLWRNWLDVQDSWTSVSNIMAWNSKNQRRIAGFSGPGHWNDPDMGETLEFLSQEKSGHRNYSQLIALPPKKEARWLIPFWAAPEARASAWENSLLALVIGNFALSYEQSKSQMAIWAILAAPLIMSVDLASIQPDFKKILLNKELIAIDQDELGIRGRLVKTVKEISIWTRPILPKKAGSDEYSYAIAFQSNRYDGIRYKISIGIAELGLQNPKGYVLKDCFDDFGKTETIHPGDLIEVKVKPSGVVLLKATVI